MTVSSVIEITNCLFNEGFEFVLTERFCQDDAEEEEVTAQQLLNLPTMI